MNCLETGRQMGFLDLGHRESVGFRDETLVERRPEALLKISPTLLGPRIPEIEHAVEAAGPFGERGVELLRMVAGRQDEDAFQAAFVSG